MSIVGAIELFNILEDDKFEEGSAPVAPLPPPGNTSIKKITIVSVLNDTELIINATLPTALTSNEKVMYSKDYGSTWIDITTSVNTTNISYTTSKLTNPTTIWLKVVSGTTSGNITTYEVTGDDIKLFYLNDYLSSSKGEAELRAIFSYDYMITRIFENETLYNKLLNNNIVTNIIFNSESVMTALGYNDIAMKVILNKSSAISYLESLSTTINSNLSSSTNFRSFDNVINKSCFVLGLYSNTQNINDITIKGVNKEIYLQKNSLPLAYSRTNGFIGKMIKGLEVKTSSNVSTTIYAKVIKF